jgi:uncharacterized repeat protein (TIGR03803 family)
MNRLNWCALLLFVASVESRAETFTTLLNFNYTDGCEPENVSLFQGNDGNLYGTTYSGGSNSDGTVIKVTPAGALTTLHSFTSSDGAYPYSGLIQAANGIFYGTTTAGGADTCGTVFSLARGGTLATLHSFAGTDGCVPYAGLIQATDGDLYGTTYQGGSNNVGTFFKITPSGALTTLHIFDVQSAYPNSALVQATDGNFYGTTINGGTYGEGTVLKLTPSGTLTTLYSFSNFPGAAYPYAGLIQAADGDLYGTTQSGGGSNYCAAGCGTIFKITTAGALTTLYSFSGPEGNSPYAELVQGTDGNFYGTTNAGGQYGFGTVFEITPAGTFTVLHGFAGPDGANPKGPLVQDTNGNFYGTTSLVIGAHAYGTIFELSMGLAPFVKTIPIWGRVGATIEILGTNLTGTTSVTFNGIPAMFKVNSETLILATVPAGATTGKLEVVIPTRTLKSNVRFQVRP